MKAPLVQLLAVMLTGTVSGYAAATRQSQRRSGHLRTSVASPEADPVDRGTEPPRQHLIRQRLVTVILTLLEGPEAVASYLSLVVRRWVARRALAMRVDDSPQIQAMVEKSVSKITGTGPTEVTLIDVDKAPIAQLQQPQLLHAGDLLERVAGDVDAGLDGAGRDVELAGDGFGGESGVEQGQDRDAVAG